MRKVGSENRRRRYIRGLGVAGLVGGIFVIVSCALIATGYTAATQIENQDAFCASCHTEPEAKYYELTQVNTSHDLASWHASQATRCIDCHSGPGVPGRLTAIGNGSRDLLAYWSGNYHQPATTQRPVGNGGCTKCHDIPVTTRGEVGEGPSPIGMEGYDGHYHADLLLIAWSSAGGPENSCVACHPAHAEVTQAAFEVPFLQQARVEAECDSCHNTLGEGERDGADGHRTDGEREHNDD